MPGPSPSEAPPELEKARQVFRFLKALAERKLPQLRRLSEQPWTLRLAELPTHPDVLLGEVQLVDR